MDSSRAQHPAQQSDVTVAPGQGVSPGVMIWGGGGCYKVRAAGQYCFAATLYWDCCNLCRTEPSAWDTASACAQAKRPVAGQIAAPLTTSSVPLYPRKLASKLCIFQQLPAYISHTAAT
jgi:hypothetical protein